MKVKAAVVQMDPQIGNLEINFKKTVNFVRMAAKENAKLIVFPECSLTGYCFQSKEEANLNALILGGEWTTNLAELAAETQTYIVVGFVEKFDEKLYNTFLVIGPEGVLGKYRKTHIPNLGVDNFVVPGSEPYSIIETPIGNIGPLICYDLRFPEQARILAMLGADFIVHITNLPITGSAQVDFLLPARANENRIFMLSADRVGEERGFLFLGRSSIFGVDGETLAQANAKDEMIIFAELDLAKAREKKVYYPAAEGKPIEHFNDLFGARRPELYPFLSHKINN